VTVVDDAELAGIGVGATIDRRLRPARTVLSSRGCSGGIHRRWRA
jgi:hypothetical protein